VASAAILVNTAFGRSTAQLQQLADLLSPRVRSSPSGMRALEVIALRIHTAAGAAAMDFTLPSPDGTPVAMADHAGRWVLLDFWSSTCMPCLRAAPLLRAVQRKYADRLDIIGISLDTRREAWTGAIEKHGMDWTHASSLEGWECPVRIHYGVVQMPAMILVGPDGRIVATSGLTAETLDETLEGLLE
jgi:peroxiredoxin